MVKWNFSVSALGYDNASRVISIARHFIRSLHSLFTTYRGHQNSSTLLPFPYVPFPCNRKIRAYVEHTCTHRRGKKKEEKHNERTSERLMLVSRRCESTSEIVMVQKLKDRRSSSRSWAVITGGEKIGGGNLLAAGEERSSFELFLG